jgi:hypothetical protein
MKNFKLHSRASALLVSFFLMSILILVGMAVSVLVIHDLRASRTMVSGTQALYAAEGMTELGLQSLKDNLPGYEETGLVDFEFLNSAMATLVVHARENDVPCEEQGEEWRALAQNESIQIPLFAQTAADGSIEEIELFYVEFYVDYGDYYVTPPSEDVLRWKILGLVNDTGTTQAVSEYIPLDSGSSTGSSVFGTDPDLIDSSAPTGYQYGKFYDNKSGVGSILDPYYPIWTFLGDHNYNYLGLTNVVTREYENTLYFRFHGEDKEGVCEYVKLASAGESGDAQQELTTLVKEGENLPVFDFVLYHTGEYTTAP